jgi:hypothetical protein
MTFGLSRTGLNPRSITLDRGDHANHYNIDSIPGELISIS